MIATTTTVHTAFGDVPVTYTDQGEGHPFLLLHGGAGSQSVRAFAELLATTRHARVVSPTNPGFDGTPRPTELATIKDLAATHLALLDALDLHDVTIVGNSIGGWTAAEMALAASPRVSSVVLVDAVGLTNEVGPMRDFFSLAWHEVENYSYYEPDHFRIDLDTLPAAATQNMAGNRATMLAVAGRAMGDPTLLARLPQIAVPVLVVWGAADGIVPLSHGRAYSTAIADAELDVIDTAGHLPQLETPERLVHDVWQFADQHATSRPERGGEPPRAI